MTKRALDHGKPPSEPLPEEPVKSKASEEDEPLSGEPPSRFSRLMKIRFRLPDKPELLFSGILLILFMIIVLLYCSPEYC